MSRDRRNNSLEYNGLRKVRQLGLTQSRFLNMMSRNWRNNSLEYIALRKIHQLG
jgi:hypothetical protein